MMFRTAFLLHFPLCLLVSAWVPSPSQRLSTKLSAHDSRRSFLGEMVTLSTTCLVVATPTESNALVKGVAPPPKKKAGGDKPKCTNMDECQAMAEKREQEITAAQEDGPAPLSTKGGTRYRDLEEGDSSKGVVRDGNEVTLYYKVLKLGKRSYDGISGEATVVFSRGFGLEEDETTPGSKSFITTVGSFQNIAALNDALLGMSVGGVRRFAVAPQRGWERPTRQCDGGPGGGGAGGDLKTDYLIVPTATMVSTESCFDQSKIPFPQSYAQQRRMAQRFDQSLLMEVQVVEINADASLS